MRLAFWKLFTLLLLITANTGPRSFAQDAAALDAASLAPANAAVFIEIHDLATLRKDWASDPLAKFLQSNLPMVPPPEGWLQVQKVMGLTGDEIVDRFFGKTVAVVVFDPSDDEPGMLITKLSDADANLAIEKLQLKPARDFAGWRGFTSADDKAHIAFGHGWAVTVQPRYSNAAQAVLEAPGQSLAQDKTYKTWLAKLPAGNTDSQRIATAYIREGESDVHAMGFYRKQRDMTIHYRGTTPELLTMVQSLGDGAALDFGPLPASTIAAITVNLAPPAAAGANAKQLDRLFSGRSYQNEIQPKLGAPTVMFLGEIPADRISPNPGLSVPVAGVSFKLKDAQVAQDLSKAIDNLIFLANFAAAKWEVPVVETKAQQHGNVAYQNANIGTALAHRTQRDELHALTLTYGRIGDWFVICTQDQFFQQCIDAHQDPALALTTSTAFKAMNLAGHEMPIATAVLKPGALADHMDTWLAHWKKVRPQVVEASQALEPTTGEAQLVRGARIVSGLLNHYQSMNIQIHRDGDVIAAKADVTRK